MNSDWKSFLGAQGARFDDTQSSVSNFGDVDGERRAVAEGNVIIDLSALGVIAASGDDTRAFLQSQLTNDAKEITSTHAQRSGYCTAKGRLLALFYIHEQDGTFYLQLPAELVESTLKRLRMFVLRSKVVLEDRSDALARFAVAGPQAPDLIAEALGSAPSAVNNVEFGNGVFVIRHAGSNPRYEVLGSPAVLQDLWIRIAAKARPVGTPAWWLLEILAGMPQVFKSSLEEFIPQMVNLPAVGGVSFQKGCYPGQEIVARMQYLGTLKRRMFLVQFGADDVPAPATPLYEAGSDGTQSVGNIVHAQRTADGDCVALAVIVIAASERGAIHVGGPSGPTLSLKELPYAVT